MPDACADAAECFARGLVGPGRVLQSELSFSHRGGEAGNLSAGLRVQQKLRQKYLPGVESQ